MKGTYAKNIPYVSAEAAKMYLNSGGASDSVSCIAAAAQFLQQKIGSQMVVAKSVTDELRNTDMLSTVSFSDVPWPSQSLEVFFEDPSMPTVLVNYVNANDVRSHGILVATKGSRYTPEQKLIRICLYGAGKGMRRYMCLAVSYSPQDMDMFARKSSVDVEYQLVGSNALSEDEQEDMREIAVWLFKVLVYCAVPRCVPKPVSKRELHYGGKPGVLGRPVRPILRVVSLPAHVHEEAHSANGKGRSRLFLGRRGHFHYYRHDRFKNRKGTFDYFPEIKTDVKTVYRVR